MESFSSSSSDDDDDVELRIRSSDEGRSDGAIVIRAGDEDDGASFAVADAGSTAVTATVEAAKPSLTSRLATGIFGAVERLMFGATDELSSAASVQNPSDLLSGGDSLSLSRRNAAGLLSNQKNLQRTPSSVTTASRDVMVRAVAIEDPQVAWAKRHAHRLHQRTGQSFHPPTDHRVIARFSNAIAGHDQYEYDDDDDPRTHSHSAFASARGLTGRRGDPYSLPDDDGTGGGGFNSVRGPGGGWTLPPGGSGSIAVELVSALEAYQGAPNEYYGSIVQAALAQRGPEDPIGGRELRWASGNPYLMQLVLASGALDVDDPDVQAIVQREVEVTIRAKERSVLSGRDGRRQPIDEKSHRLRLDPSVAGYLKMLFVLPSSRINADQVALLEDSGFEFVKLLHDHPHIMRDVAKPPWWQLKPYEEHRHVDLMASVLGMALILVDLASIIAIAIHWWQSRTNFGYWTILLALGGWVVTLVVVIVFESTKVDSSFYDERLAEFPSSNVKLVPVLPTLEMILVWNIVRYYIAARRDKRAYFVVTHDLHANFAVLFILHSQCHSFPQLLLQNYLFVWGSFNEPDYIFFRILVVTTSISCCTSLLLFLRRIACFRSVNGAGFSVFGAEGSEANFDSRGEFFPKVITFILIYMLEYNVFFVIVAVMNVSSCSTTVLVWIGIIGLIIVAVIVILVFSLAKGKSSSTTGKLALGPLMAQIAFAIYGSVFSNTQSSSDGTEEASCAFYSFTLGANVRVGIAAFSLMLLVWVIWIVTTIWRRYGTMDKRIPLGSKVRWLLFSQPKHGAVAQPQKTRHHAPEEDGGGDSSDIEGVVPAPIAGDPIDAVQVDSNRADSTDRSMTVTPEISIFQPRSARQPVLVG
jgi:hypothetical protein